MRALGRILAVLALIVAAPASAQTPPEMELPWTDVAPSRVGAVVRAAALGAADERIGSFTARRAAAREVARRRALAALHAWVDDALAAVRAPPMEASAVHAAVDRDAHVTGVRPLADGGAVAVMEIGVEALRAACAREGLPWVD